MSMLSTSFCAVPDFSRVEPATISGPTSGVIAISTARASSESGVQLIPIVDRAQAPGFGDRAEHIRRAAAGGDADEHVARSEAAREQVATPIAGSSSVVSVARLRAASPPAMMPCTNSGGTLKVGGHSEASSTPSRPLVPAPI